MAGKIRHHREPNPVELTTSIDKLCFIVVKAKEFDAKVDVVEPDPGGNPSDDADREVLEDYPDDPTYQELYDAIAMLNDDEQIEVLALTWLGRGDYDGDEWKQALADAAAAHNASEPGYLIGTPLLGDYLEEGLDKLGHSCGDTAVEHL